MFKWTLYFDIGHRRTRDTNYANYEQSSRTFVVAISMKKYAAKQVCGLWKAAIYESCLA